MTTSHSSISLIGVSDFHTGNLYGIRSTPRNNIQDILLRGLDKCIDKIKQPKRVEELLIGGDMVDGPNSAKPAVDLWTIYPQIAVNDAAQILKPLLKLSRGKSRVVRGSSYHVEPRGSYTNYDEELAQRIESTPITNSLLDEKPRLLEQAKQLTTTNFRVAQRSKIKTQALELINNTELEATDKSSAPFQWRSAITYKNVFNDVAIVLKHFTAFSPNYMYRGTGLTRNDVIMSLQKEKHFKTSHKGIIHLYGHTHYYHYVGNASHLNMTIPCWKGKDSFLQDKDVSEPDFGIVEIIIEPNSQIEFHGYVLEGEDYPVD